MSELRDISSPADIELLLNTFYAKATQDPLIGSFFTEVLAHNWPAHFSAICSFWESIAFGTPGYKGDPMKVHLQVHAQQTMRAEHFDRWLQLFTTTVNTLFEGKKAEELKARAASIASIMLLKIKAA